MAEETPQGWIPKGTLDFPSRQAKARKLIKIIEERKPLAGTDILDLGCGAGVTAVALAEATGEKGSVRGADIEDMRLIKEGYEFDLISGTSLPYEDHQFDVIVTNHTIEHVGDTTEQQKFTDELRRIVKNDGIIYLATPNRWNPIEPHFKLPFLSYLPKPARSPYVRLANKGDVYDINPCTIGKLRELTEKSNFYLEPVASEAARNMAEYETTSSARKFGLNMLSHVTRYVPQLSPTNVIILRPKNAV